MHPTFTSDVIQMRPSPKPQFTVFSRAENLDSSKKPFLLSYDSSIHFKSLSESPLGHQSSARIDFLSSNRKTINISAKCFGKVRLRHMCYAHSVKAQPCTHQRRPLAETPEMSGRESSVQAHQEGFSHLQSLNTM